MAKFKKGDICEVIYSMFPELMYRELTLTSDAQYDPDGQCYYSTDLVYRNFPMEAEEYTIRLKKNPPEEDTKFKGEENIMKLFTNLDNSSNIEADKLVEEVV